MVFNFMDDVVNCSIFDLGRDVGYEVIFAQIRLNIGKTSPTLF